MCIYCLKIDDIQMLKNLITLDNSENFSKMVSELQINSKGKLLNSNNQ